MRLQQQFLSCPKIQGGGTSIKRHNGKHPSTIKNTVEICVMLEGEIVELGTHEELLPKNGYYKRLNDMQSP